MVIHTAKPVTIVVEELRLLEALLERGDGAHEQRAGHEAAGGSPLGVAQWLAERTIDS